MNYQLTIRINIGAVDDPAARREARVIRELIQEGLDGKVTLQDIETKLQELARSQAPRKVAM